MRFSSISLERYGRFEDCELQFRAGDPDLHVIYGANEAGKTTSLAAVSDLLFGFPQRSRYNFLFDYTLLRVGAVLEQAGRTFACRRKKGTSGTLLDTSDAAIDEAPLLAMLKGQTRETFGLSFSLDQDALRSGGRAMVEARNDLGRTLFAAGSGLTGIAEELKRLEAEADAIWGPQAAARRSFTQAQRELADRTKAVRDEALKPKAWSDARTASERTGAALETARSERDSVLTEVGAAERVRRLAPLVRRRAEELDELRSHEATIDVGKQREDAAETVIQDADAAQRARSAAEQLLRDVTERKAKVAADPLALAESGEIDELVVGSGAGEKAARDVVGLEAEHSAAETLVRRLRVEAGANAEAAPPRAVAAKLRDLARKYAETAAATVQIEESRGDLEERRRRANAKLDGAGAEQSADALVDAVDAARALGADADARCDSARHAAETAGGAVAAALSRLAPWTGTISDLSALPGVSADEIETARAGLLELASEIRREEEQAHRLRDDAAGLALEIEGLGKGAAVSPEEIAGARENREARWQPLRRHTLSGTPLPSPADAVAAFEASVALVDERMELRFTLADASSRLSLLEKSKASNELHASQAEARAADAGRRRDETLERWTARLASSGLPTVEPVRLQAWQSDREAAAVAQRAHDKLSAEANAIVARRDAARFALAVVLGGLDAGGTLAPVLATAERRRREIEAAAQERLLARSELDQVDEDGASLARRAQRLDTDASANSAAWTTSLAEAGLDLDIVTCGAVLGVIEELREATASQAQLRRRIDGISRDARDHASRVNAVADRLGVPAAGIGTRVRALRDRLAEARSAAKLLEALDLEEARRSVEVDEAGAKLRAADEMLAPLMAETASADRAALTAAIERSRARRLLAERLAETERRLVDDGDGLALDELVAAASGSDPDELVGRVSALNFRLAEFNTVVDGAATAHGDAKRTFADLESGTTSAADAAADAEQARSEIEVLAEDYILRRAQTVTLKWAIEQYRERHQDPMLLRAGVLFSILTTGRYATLRVDTEGTSPRLLGLRDDGRTIVEVGHMSEGTTDQLFLALRLAALEQSVAAGIDLPFLADDLFVNFDDERAEAGFRVLADVARSTQVLFFTHHQHLGAIAKSIVGAKVHSECALS